MKKNLFFLFIAFLFISSCKKEDTITIVFNLKNLTGKTDKNRAYSINDTAYRILFSNFEFIDYNNHSTLVKEVFLFHSTDKGFTFKMPKGNFKSFKFYFGLDKATNNSIPMNFPAKNPLSVENGMYWDMLKYRFLVVEGNIDNSPTKDQTPTLPFSMHLGSDTLYSEIPVANLPQKGKTLQVNIDMRNLFVLDSTTFEISNFSNHSTSAEIPKAISIKNNWINGITTSIE
ncbi:MAG TPA: hypothetical protein PLK15_03585 [Chitinophagales bacterium]|jgi:hypothetical protein|nr:hypothetical protein [Chitinophagales bacterium]